MPSPASSPAHGANGAPVEPNRRADLTQDEFYRYSRHVLLPEVGVRGQERLKEGSVLIVGAGGLGSPSALYLAAAGVGRIGIIDPDRVDATNLQRQILYGESDVGRPKTEAARRRLEDLNPHIQIDTHDAALTADNALELCGAYDVVVDGTDNFATRYLVNDACVLTGTPNAYGSIFRFEGQASVFGTAQGPCYRCLYAVPPPPGLMPSCAEGGVLGVLPGIIGSIQAVETIKTLLGAGDSLAGRLLLFDALDMSFTTLKVAKDPACPVCGTDPTITEPIDYDAFCGTGEAVAALADEHLIDIKTLMQRIDRGEAITVVDVREPGETEIIAMPFARNIPLRELPHRLADIPKDRPVVLHCKTGLRSATAWQILREAGYEEIHSLVGGILAYQEEVAPGSPRY